VTVDDSIRELTAARRMSHGEQLARTARRSPDTVAFRFGDVDRTFAELDERVNRLANALAERGVGSGRASISHLRHLSPPTAGTASPKDQRRSRCARSRVNSSVYRTRRSGRLTRRAARHRRRAAEPGRRPSHERTPPSHQQHHREQWSDTTNANSANGDPMRHGSQRAALGLRCSWLRSQGPGGTVWHLLSGCAGVCEQVLGQVIACRSRLPFA